ncbi:MAG: LacI family DNA-binding transcriptional regulator [Verrucomicrobia bacterium]|nr:LacI family DNA-binding transcriptional regulator [Verrucomicrobiota bacterium]
MNHHAPPTMQQVADELKLSRCTVSWVVNGKARKLGIAQRTIDRVQRFLAQRGYVPSRAALALRTGRPSPVGILYCSLYSHLVEALNWMVERFSTQPDGIELVAVRREDLVKGMTEIVGRKIRHLIWIQSGHPEFMLTNREALMGLVSNVPTVLYNYYFDESDLDRVFESLGISMVGFSRRKGFEKLARFLKKLGHCRVVLAGVSPALDEPPARTYLRQSLAVFEEAGLEPMPAGHPDYATECARVNGEVLAAAVLSAMKTRAVTAACFRDDAVAAFAMLRLKKLGVRIPEDLTVTGFDGLEIGETLCVPLTTMRVPTTSMVERVEQILTTRPHQMCHVFEAELVLRESHAMAARPENIPAAHSRSN